MEEISAMPQGFLAIDLHGSVSPTKYLILTETKSLGTQRVHEVSGKESLFICYLSFLSLAFSSVFLFFYICFLLRLLCAPLLVPRRYLPSKSS